MTKSRVRRVTPREQWINPRLAQDVWPITEEPKVALGEPDTGVDQADFYRWRRNRSDPPPPPFERPPRAKR